MNHAIIPPLRGLRGSWGCSCYNNTIPSGLPIKSKLKTIEADIQKGLAELKVLLS